MQSVVAKKYENVRSKNLALQWSISNMFFVFYWYSSFVFTRRLSTVICRLPNISFPLKSHYGTFFFGDNLQQIPPHLQSICHVLQTRTNGCFKWFKHKNHLKHHMHVPYTRAAAPYTFGIFSDSCHAQIITVYCKL